MKSFMILIYLGLLTFMGYCTENIQEEIQCGICYESVKAWFEYSCGNHELCIMKNCLKCVLGMDPKWKRKCMYCRGDKVDAVSSVDAIINNTEFLKYNNFGIDEQATDVQTQNKLLNHLIKAIVERNQTKIDTIWKFFNSKGVLKIEDLLAQLFISDPKLWIFNDDDVRREREKLFWIILQDHKNESAFVPYFHMFLERQGPFFKNMSQLMDNYDPILMTKILTYSNENEESLSERIFRRGKMEEIKWLMQRLTNEKEKHALSFVLKSRLKDISTFLRMFTEWDNAILAKSILDEIQDPELLMDVLEQKNDKGESAISIAMCLRRKNMIKLILQIYMKNNERERLRNQIMKEKNLLQAYVDFIEENEIRNFLLTLLLEQEGPLMPVLGLENFGIEGNSAISIAWNEGKKDDVKAMLQKLKEQNSLDVLKNILIGIKIDKQKYNHLYGEYENYKASILEAACDDKDAEMIKFILELFQDKEELLTEYLLVKNNGLSFFHYLAEPYGMDDWGWGNEEEFLISLLDIFDDTTKLNCFVQCMEQKISETDEEDVMGVIKNVESMEELFTKKFDYAKTLQYELQ